MTKGAASITIVTLLDKPSRRTKAITADLAGFVVPDEFVVGYGLDYCQQYRNVPYIGVLKPEVRDLGDTPCFDRTPPNRNMKTVSCVPGNGKGASARDKTKTAIQSELCTAGLVILLCVNWLAERQPCGPAGILPGPPAVPAGKSDGADH